jgi:sporulation protein YlmC with PRC-barrel domain
MFDRSKSNRFSATAGVSKEGCLVGVKSLVDNNVYDARGNLVGKLEELVIDTRTGCVRHAVLAVGGILGIIGRRRFAVPWSALNPDADYRRCVVDLTQMQLTAVRVPDDDPWLRGTDSARASEGRSRPSRLFGAKA